MLRHYVYWLEEHHAARSAGEVQILRRCREKRERRAPAASSGARPGRGRAAPGPVSAPLGRIVRRPDRCDPQLCAVSGCCPASSVDPCSRVGSLLWRADRSRTGAPNDRRGIRQVEVFGIIGRRRTIENRPSANAVWPVISKRLDIDRDEPEPPFESRLRCPIRSDYEHLAQGPDRTSRRWGLEDRPQ